MFEFIYSSIIKCYYDQNSTSPSTQCRKNHAQSPPHESVDESNPPRHNQMSPQGNPHPRRKQLRNPSELRRKQPNATVWQTNPPLECRHSRNSAAAITTHLLLLAPTMPRTIPPMRSPPRIKCTAPPRQIYAATHRLGLASGSTPGLSSTPPALEYP